MNGDATVELDETLAVSVPGASATGSITNDDSATITVADASVDVVISNCVINLSPEKINVFREAMRVLATKGLVDARPMRGTRVRPRAEWRLLDPDLLASCPPPLIAADGMDALTQLLESYVSSRANPMTDALAWSGLEAARDSLLPWYEGRGDQCRARSGMAYAALLSGITLAQTGLGSVHGLASPLGAFFPIPHGVVCGTLVGAATRANISAMRAREPDNPALEKYARVAELLCRVSFQSREQAWEALTELLDDWTARLRLPTLDDYGITRRDLANIVAHARGSSMKTNPIVMTDEEISAVLQQRCSTCGAA